MKATSLIGKDLMVFVDSKATALATNHVLNVTTDMVDTANKDTGIWNDAIPGRMSWEITSDNVYSNDVDNTAKGYDDLMNAWMSRQKVTVRFGIPANADAESEVPSTGWSLPTGGYEGSAYITSLSATAPTTENATFSVTFTGVGKLTKIETP